MFTKLIAAAGRYKFIFLSLLFSGCSFTGLFAQDVTPGTAAKPAYESPMVLFMILIMLILLLAIGLLSHVLKGATDIYREKMNRERAGGGTTVLLIIFLFLSPSLFANETPAESHPVSSSFDMGGLSPVAFYLMWSIIALELLVLFAMLVNLKIILGFTKKKETSPQTAVEYKPLKTLWQKLNSFKPVEQEADIQLEHSYDGIRELDNRLPPWWLYGFYVTIIFSVIYLWRFHVSHSAPSTEEEYIAAMQVADAQKQAYLKKAANQVDENTVKLLSAETDLSAGKSIFESNCTACHGKAGEGVVGPNLTDDYWLHGGSVNDVFKTIKYGVPEKGMRNWNEDFSPVQIAQLASFIKSLHGSNPPNGKEKQGERFIETMANMPASGADKIAGSN